MYARDGNSIVPCIQKILKNVSTHNIFDFPVNIIRLGNYKFCIRARLSIVPNFMCAFSFFRPLPWQQQRANIESANLLSPYNFILALNKCKDVYHSYDVTL